MFAICFICSVITILSIKTFNWLSFIYKWYPHPFRWYSRSSLVYYLAPSQVHSLCLVPSSEHTLC